MTTTDRTGKRFDVGAVPLPDALDALSKAARATDELRFAQVIDITANAGNHWAAAGFGADRRRLLRSRREGWAND